MRHTIERQQILGCIVWMMVMEDFLEHVRFERFQPNGLLGTREQRFLTVLKNSLHHRVDRTADDQIHLTAVSP